MSTEEKKKIRLEPWDNLRFYFLMSSQKAFSLNWLRAKEPVLTWDTFPACHEVKQAIMFDTSCESALSQESSRFLPRENTWKQLSLDIAHPIC